MSPSQSWQKAQPAGIVDCWERNQNMETVSKNMYWNLHKAPKYTATTAVFVIWRKPGVFLPPTPNYDPWISLQNHWHYQQLQWHMKGPTVCKSWLDTHHPCKSFIMTNYRLRWETWNTLWYAIIYTDIKNSRQINSVLLKKKLKSYMYLRINNLQEHINKM